MALVKVRVGEEVLVASPLPAGAFLVRFHPDENTPYDRMIVVTRIDGGKTIHLAGWIAKGELSHTDWLTYAAALFPDATHVRFERRRKCGRIDHKKLPIRTPAPFRAENRGQHE